MSMKADRAIQDPDTEGDATFVCSHCKSKKPDLIGLSMAETVELDAEEFGFCSLACLVVFVRTRYIEVAA
jgi:hypothetical protein